jgi:transcriptional regulator with XRE-family HTH domain
MSLISRAGTMKRFRRSKAAREKFVDALIDNSIPTQIRAIRDRQGLSQERLAELAGGMNQNAISRLESPSYGKPTLTTLKRIASALDVGLVVRFVPFSELADWVSGTPRVDLGRSTETLAVPSFTEEEKTQNDVPHRVPSLYLPQMRRGLVERWNFVPGTQTVTQLLVPKPIVQKPFTSENGAFMLQPNLLVPIYSPDVCPANQLS